VAPTIERIAPDRARVTFTYEDAAARSIALSGAITALMDDPVLERDGSTWKKTVEAPSDLRTVYWFARNGDEREDWRRWFVDPLNPNRYVYPAGLEFTADGEMVASMLELPDAPPYEWSVERDVPRGEVRLENAAGRHVWVYSPPCEPAGLLVLFDGLQYTTIAPAPVVLDNLVAANRIPPLAAVLPDSLDTASRRRELACNAEWLRVVVEDLVPLAGVDAGPDMTVVAGSSLGGVAAAYAALERPDVFGNALVQSGAWPAVPGKVERRVRRRRVPVRWYLDVGTLEGELLEPNRAMRRLLEERGYEITYREFPGGHEFLWWQETLAWGLLALLGE